MEEQGSGDSNPNAHQQSSSGAVTFALPKFKKPRPPAYTRNPNQSDAEHAEPEYFTLVDDRGFAVSDAAESNAAPKIIPQLENTWRPDKVSKNRALKPELEVADMFVQVTLATGPHEGIQDGLSVKESTDDLDVETHAKEQRKGGLEMAEFGGRSLLAEAEKRKFREDLELCAEDTSMDAYEQMPVEEFGLALLRGFGWERGMPIGRNSRVVVEPVQYVRRDALAGLGATPLPQLETKASL